MSSQLRIRNEGALQANSEQNLSIAVTTEDGSQVFLAVPLGDAATALMKTEEFKALQPELAEYDADDAPSVASKVDGEVGRIGVEWAGRSFVIALKKFRTNASGGTVVLKLEDSGRNELASAQLTKISDPPPRIRTFVSDKYNVVGGNEIRLTWELDPPGQSVLEQIIPPPDEARKAQLATMTSGSALRTPEGEFSRYKLQAKKPGANEATDERFLTIYAYRKTEVISRRGPEGGGVLGVYSRSKRAQLYALVRDADSTKPASIWRSAIGFDPNSWTCLDQVGIPADAAERPGIVFDDKLYFMGGSSYDANAVDRRVGYFDFETNTWFDRGKSVRDEAWPPEMPARMGHAVLAAPDDQTLWVIGGYDENGAARNDIWVYSKNAQPGRRWQPYATPPWKPRCLFGATFMPRKGKHDLWIAGGFDSPGGFPTYDDVWRCSDVTAKGGEWNRVGQFRENLDPHTKQYCGCALIPLRGKVLAFWAYYDTKLGKGTRESLASFSSSDDKNWQMATEDVGRDWLGKDVLDWYRLDATEWGGCIFLRRLDRAKEKDELLHYFVWV